MENKHIFGFRKIAGVLIACAIGMSVYTGASAQEQSDIIYVTMNGDEIEISVPWTLEEGEDPSTIDPRENPFFTGDEEVTEEKASDYVSNLGEAETYMEDHLATINAVREERALEPLQLDEELIKFATLKAADMAENHYFDHDRPETGNIGEQYKYFLKEPGDKNPENFSMSLTMFSLDSTDPNDIQEEIYDYLTDEEGLSNSITSEFYNSFGVAYYHDKENNIFFAVQLFHNDPVEEEDVPDTGEETPGEETPGEETPEQGTDFTREEVVINYQHVERTLEFENQQSVQGIQLFTSLNGEPVDIFEATNVDGTLTFSLPFNGFEVDRVYHERLAENLTFETVTNDAGEPILQITTSDLDNEDSIFLVQTAKENPLAESITTATTTINALEHLTDEQKQQFVTRVEAAGTEEAINTVVKEAQAANDTAAPDPLASSKETATGTINALEHLTDEQKQQYVAQVAAAKSEEAINTVVKEAQAANDTAAPDPLAEVKDTAKNTVLALENLSEEELAGFVGRINDAETAEVINEVVSEAEGLDAQNDSSFVYEDIVLRYRDADLVFNQHEGREYQAIELLPTVNDEPVDPFDASDVDETYTFSLRFDEFTVSEIQNVDNAAPIAFEVQESAEGQVLRITVDTMSRLLLLGDEIDQLADQRTAAKETINALQHLDEEQVTAFNNQIDGAETQEAIDAVVSEAQTANEDQTPDPLADAKAAAKETVNALQHLSAEQLTAFNNQIDTAETQEAIDAVVSEAQTANEDQTPDPLADAKAAAKETVNALQHLSEEQLTAFNNQIDTAETQEAIDAVVSEAQTTNEDQTPDPLADAKAAAKETVGALEHLDEAQVTDFNSRIDAAETQEAIDAVVSEAQTVNEDQTPDPLADAKATAKETVGALEHIDEAQVTDFNSRIDAAGTQEAIDAVVSEAETVNEDQTPDPLADAKATAKETVGALEHLDEAQMTDFNSRIDAAETQEAIDAVVSEAETVNEDQTPDPLADVKATAKETVGALEHIDEAQVTDFNSRIDAAETQEAIDAVVSEAETANENQTPDPLADAKAAAKETVTALPNLADNLKTEYHNQIDAADTQEAIDGFVSDAESLNALVGEKADGLQTISELSNLSDEQRSGFNQRIETAETSEEITTVLEEAATVDADQAPDPLADEKSSAKETVGALEHLEEGQVTEFNQQINNAESQEAIDSVVSEAQSTNEDQTPDPLADAKSSAKETVGALEHLEEGQVTEFNQQINNAESQEAIDSVVSEAQSTNEDQTPDPLADAKSSAKETVGALEHLEEGQVTEFNQQINNAESQEAIDSVVSEAQSTNEDQTPDPLADEKSSAKETVGALEHLEEGQVTEFNQQIDNAESQEAIDSVVSEAQSTNEDQTPDPLADEKSSAKETVGALEHLEEGQVTEFNKQIDNAESQEAIDSVVSEAQTANEDQTPDPLEDAKSVAVNAVSELQNITDEEKQSFINQIQSAVSADAINALITDAENMNTLSGNVDDALGTISEMQNLDDGQRAEFNQRIETAESSDEITTILEEASALDADQAPDPLQSEKDAAKQSVSALEHLEEAQVTEYNQRIDTAESTQDINNVLEEATSTNDDQTPDPLADAKASAENTISQLQNLTEDEKNEFLSQLESAESQDAINTIIRESENMNTLAEDKANALNTISEMQNLDDSQRADFNQEIENAESTESVTTILEEAAALDAGQAPDPLQAEKDEAKQSVSDNENLDETQVSEFHQRIDDAESTQDINNIVEEAVSVNDEQAPDELQSHKDEAKKAIDALENVSDETKSTMKEDIDAADSAEDIEAVVTEAERIDNEQAEEEDPLADSKEAAKKEVLALEYLNEETLALFISQINEAEDQDMIDRLVREANETNESRKRDMEEDNITEAEIIGGTLDESEVEDMPEPRDDDNELIMSIKDSGVYIEGTVGERLIASGITLPGATVTIKGNDQTFEIVAGEDGLFEGTIPYFSSGTELSVIFTSEDGETYETSVTLVYDPTTKTVKGGSDHDVVITEQQESEGNEEVAEEDEDDLPATGLINNIGLPIAGGIALLGIGLFALFFRRR